MGYALFIDANNPIRQLERAGASPEVAREQWAEMLGALPAEAVPNVHALRAYFEVDTDEDSEVFDTSLDLLINAARSRIEGSN